MRICAIQEKNLKDKENNNSEIEIKGEWSEVISMTTLDLSTFDRKSCGSHANHVIKGIENILTFTKSGLVVGTNPFSFGVCSFEVKLELQSAHHSAEDSSCIKLGLNKYEKE